MHVSRSSSLLTELKQNPLRPVKIRELKALHQGGYGRSEKIGMNAQGYQRIYENTFFIIELPKKTVVALAEVPFNLGHDKSVELSEEYLKWQSVMTKLMQLGLASTLFDACRDWETKAAGRKIQADPNDIQAQKEHLGPLLSKRRQEIALGLLDPKEREIMQQERLIGLPAFLYLGGFGSYQEALPVGRYHTHLVTGRDDDEYFPSKCEPYEPVIWAPIDTGFIHVILSEDGTTDEKRKRIIEHHVTASRLFEVIGIRQTDEEYIPLLR